MAGEYKAVASLDNSRFLSGLSGMSSGLGGMMGKLAGLTAGFLGVRSVINGFSQALDLGGGLADLSQRTGVAVKDLFILQKAFGQVGSSSESVAPAIQKMQQVIGGISKTGKIGRKILDQLGLNPEELKKLGTQDQFMTIATAIGTIADPAQQTAAAIELLGEAGPQLKELFKNPAIIKQTAAALGELPDQLQKNAARFDDLGDRMELLKVRGQGIFVGAMEGLAPAISQIMALMEKIDFSKIGKAIGDGIGIAVELFASGDIETAAYLAISIGFAKAVNLLASTVGSFTWWNGAAQFAIGAFMKLGAVLIRIFSEPLSYMEAGITWILERLWEAMGKIPMLGKAMGLDQFKARSFSENLADSKASGIFSQSSADSADAAAKPFLADGMRLMREALANPKNVIDASEWQRQLTELMQKARAAAESRAQATEPQTLTTTASGDVAIHMPQESRGKSMEIASDAYARIGGYLGGAGGSGIDYTRRTATATEKSVTLLGTIASKLQPAQTPVAAWG